MRRHTAEAPLEAEVPAERCRDAHRAGAVAADAQRREPRGDRRCCPAGGPAARLARIPRVTGDAGHRRVGLALAAELGRRGLADEDRAGLPKASSRWRVDIPRLVGVNGEAPPSRRPPSREEQVLDRGRHAIEGAHRLTPLPTRLALPPRTPTPSAASTRQNALSVGFSAIDPVEHRLCRLHGRRGPLPIQVEELGRGELREVGAVDSRHRRSLAEDSAACASRNPFGWSRPKNASKLIPRRG